MPSPTGAPPAAAGDPLSRLRSVRQPHAPADPTLLDALIELDGPIARADAGHLLARVPVERIAPRERRLRPLRVAMVGTFTADGVLPLLRLALLQERIVPEIKTFGFDQLMVQLSDPDAALAAYAPDVTLCQLDDRFFLSRDWDRAAPAELEELLTQRTATIESAVCGFVARTPGTVLLHTVPLSPIERRKLTGYNAKAHLGRVWRSLNSRLLELPGGSNRIHTLDFEAALVDCAARLRDDRLMQFAGMAWSPGVELCYAHEAARFCHAVAGLAKKVLVLDLDNTLWGGILGDDGPAGIQVGGQYPGNCFAELQRAAAAWRRQGVLLALCSKNDPALVDDVLDNHPELVLRSQDFVARAVNWGRKDHNIRQIAESLNLGLDSIVFVDDSRFECELIRRELPEVEVVHLGGDPADHLAALVDAARFDVPTTTAADARRTQLYRARADRQRFAGSFKSAADYLGQLELQVEIMPADGFSLPRLEQLRLRTNQFNLAGRALNDPPAGAMTAHADRHVLSFAVSDRFGREGIVGGVWIDRRDSHWVIENFVMSCRVFSRGIEQAVLARVAGDATADGAAWLDAHYRPTERNRPVETFLESAGFVRGDERDGVIAYRLALKSAPQLKPAWIVLNEKDAGAHV